MSAPWFKFYPSAWRSDPALRMCSIAARGLWMEMLCVMHEATPRGTLLINGTPLSDRHLAGLSGVSVKDVAAYLAELEAAGVFSREDNGTIYSRRMRRDDEKAVRDKQNGKGGGNPSLKGGVNPPPNPGDKAKKLEARDKSSEATASGADAPPDPAIEKRELFDRGKAVLGRAAGGVVTELLRAKGGNVALARAAIEQASQAQNPAEYVGRIIHPKTTGGSGNGADVVGAGARLVERARQAERAQHAEFRGGSGNADVRLLEARGRG